MSRNYTVSSRINRPVNEVFAAVVEHEQLVKYFTDVSSGNLAEGERIVWHWKGWGDHPVTVRSVETGRRIELVLNSKDWNKTREDAYDVRVIFEFEESDDGGTILSISESGWRTDAEGLKGSHDNCGGWMHMATCLKAFLEHGVDLRE